LSLGSALRTLPHSNLNFAVGNPFLPHEAKNVELVTVIIPAFNSERLINHAIDSVIAQGYPNIEIIVVDDGSTDGTVATARRKLTTDAIPGQVLELGTNRGPSAARNAGLRIANGSWVQFLDSDDLLMPRKFEKQMAVCANAPLNVVAVYSPFAWGFIKAGHVQWLGPVMTPFMSGKAPIMCLASRCRPLLNAGLTRRAALSRVGGFDEDLRFWECEEINVRLAEIGTFLPVPSDEPLYIWGMDKNLVYIGGPEARHNSEYVAMGWIEQALKGAKNRTLEEMELPQEDRTLLLRECTLWGRLLYSQNRHTFRKYLALAQKLDPKLVPIYPRYVAALSRLVGYETAEAIATVARKPKVWLRSALCALKLRQRNVITELSCFLAFFSTAAPSEIEGTSVLHVAKLVIGCGG
jgi:glycosyltransferase involved in cell wall biosynthesis